MSGRAAGILLLSKQRAQLHIRRLLFLWHIFFKNIVKEKRVKKRDQSHSEDGKLGNECHLQKKDRPVCRHHPYGAEHVTDRHEERIKDRSLYRIIKPGLQREYVGEHGRPDKRHG